MNIIIIIGIIFFALIILFTIALLFDIFNLQGITKAFMEDKEDNE